MVKGAEKDVNGRDNPIFNDMKGIPSRFRIDNSMERKTKTY